MFPWYHDSLTRLAVLPICNKTSLWVESGEQKYQRDKQEKNVK